MPSHASPIRSALFHRNSGHGTKGLGNSCDQGSDSLVQQLHTVLRPFILRRLKVDVERGMPPKTELTVYCQLAAPQLHTYKAVLKNHVEVLNSKGGERMKLLNIIMQLRKAANHPYLFDGVEVRILFG